MIFSFQEAILRLSGVVSLEQLEEATKDALEAALPNTVSKLQYVIHLHSHKVFFILWSMKYHLNDKSYIGKDSF